MRLPTYRDGDFHRYKPNKNYLNGVDSELIWKRNGELTFCKSILRKIVSFCIILSFGSFKPN